MNKKVMITHTNGKTIHHVDTVGDDTVVIYFTDGTRTEIKAEFTSKYDAHNQSETTAHLTYP